MPWQWLVWAPNCASCEGYGCVNAEVMDLPLGSWNQGEKYHGRQLEVWRLSGIFFRFNMLEHHLSHSSSTGQVKFWVVTSCYPCTPFCLRNPPTWAKQAVAAQMNGVGKTHHIHRQIHRLQAFLTWLVVLVVLVLGRCYD